MGSPFSCVTWINFGEDKQYSKGIIITGLEDGSLSLWDPV